MSTERVVNRQTEVILREFAGWLSADLPELWDVEVPRLAESLDRFLAALKADKGFAAAPPPTEQP